MDNNNLTLSQQKEHKMSAHLINQTEDVGIAVSAIGLGLWPRRFRVAAEHIALARLHDGERARDAVTLRMELLGREAVVRRPIHQLQAVRQPTQLNQSP